VPGLAVDSHGDVVAVGGKDEYALAIKLAGSTGQELWRRSYDSFGYVYSVFQSTAIDSRGNVLVAGSSMDSGHNYDILAVKLDGATGQELWHRDVHGPAHNYDFAFAVATDGNDDVLVAGSTSNPIGSFGSRFTIIKFAGLDGQELWRYTLLLPDPPYNDVASSLAIDSFGDVIAVGSTFDRIGNTPFIVVKVSGATGQEQWRQVIRSQGAGGTAAICVSVDSKGDVIAGGQLDFFTRTYLKIASARSQWMPAEQNRGSFERSIPNERGGDAAIASRRRSARPASGARIGVVDDRLVSFAFDWTDAVRSSQCRPFAMFHRVGRCRKRDHRSGSRAWLRSYRSQRITEPALLHDGSLRGC